MGRNVFFSFHYEDVASFRANVVRNSWRFNKNNAGNPVFSDGSIWEEAKKKGVADLKKLIQDVGLNNTSVTTVLIGKGTCDRRWVRYELVKSFEKGNGILAVYINRIKDKTGHIEAKGNNPLDKLGFIVSSKTNKVTFFEVKESKWVQYADLPQINNKRANSIFFGPTTLLTALSLDNRYDKFHKFSDFFKTYCWINNDGSKYFGNWVEESHGTKIYF